MEHPGLQVRLIGLARPGLVAAARLRAAGVAVRDPMDAARDGAAPPDSAAVTLALVDGARDRAPARASAGVEDLPARDGLLTLGDGALPVALVIARGVRSPDPSVADLELESTPIVYGRPGLVVAHVALRHEAGGWRVTAVRQERVRPDPEPDPGILALAGDAWRRAGPWLAEPTRAVVTGPNRKADFMACAGALSHAAVATATGAGADAATLLPQLWVFEPLRKARRGSRVTRGDLFRWMPHEDWVLAAELTGRQIGLLLGPYARWRAGWDVAPSLVLHPGSLAPRVVGRATQVEQVVLAGSGAVLDWHRAVPVWLTDYHAFGAGGLARGALVRPEQLGAPLPLSLREQVYRWMASDGFAVPGECAPFLAAAPLR